jgi:ferric-dicitrate binding protein FerR (iron transport regulator)
MKGKNYIQRIIEQYLLGRYGRETEEKVQQWLIDGERETEKNRHLESFWDSLPESSSPSVEAKESLKKLKARLGMDKTPATIFSANPWVRIAAVLLPFIFLASSYLCLTNMPESHVAISVPYGEMKAIRLPDASAVVLNSGSNIRYPASFGKKERRIKLSGEAWFSVVKEASRPFVVETEHLSVEVLGTEFNVKDNPGDVKATATLSRGKIKVATKDKQSHILAPGLHLSYDSKSKRTDIAEVNAGDYSAWKDGHLVFDNMPLAEILPVVERKFNISIRVDTPVDSTNRYSIKFVHGENFREVMEILVITCGFSFRVGK